MFIKEKSKGLKIIEVVKELKRRAGIAKLEDYEDRLKTRRVWCTDRGDDLRRKYGSGPTIYHLALYIFDDEEIKVRPVTALLCALKELKLPITSESFYSWLKKLKTSKNKKYWQNIFSSAYVLSEEDIIGVEKRKKLIITKVNKKRLFKIFPFLKEFSLDEEKLREIEQSF